MFLASALLCASIVPTGEPLAIRDLAPFARLDARVRALPIPSVRSYAGIAKGLSAVAISPLERARAAYVWTTANMTYSLDRHRDATAALADLKGDCDAHASVFAGLCRSLGVECATVGGSVRYAIAPGTALAGVSKPLAPGQWLVGHAWSAVCVGGRWGLVDATLGGVRRPKGEAPADDYFLPDPEVLATDHLPDDARWRMASAPSDLAQAPLVRPLAWRLGFDAETIRPGGCVVRCPRLAWRKGLRAAFQSEAGGEPDRALVQPDGEGTEVRFSPLGRAAVAWLGMTIDGVWRPVVGYPVVGTSARLLPRLMSRFYDSGATLVGPFERDLARDRSTEIRLRAPGASQVVAFQGEAMVGTFVREGDVWALRTSPSTGALEIMASYADPNEFQALVRYDVK